MKSPYGLLSRPKFGYELNSKIHFMCISSKFILSPKKLYCTTHIDARRATRIATYHVGAIQDTPSELKSLQAWAVDAMVHLYLALNAPLQRAIDKKNEL